MTNQIVQKQEFTQQISTVISALELEFELTRDTLSLRGRKYRQFLKMIEEIRYEITEEFLCFLAEQQFIAHKRELQQLMSELNEESESARRRQRKIWAEAQLEKVPEKGASDNVKSLLDEILHLLALAGLLTKDYLLFVFEQQRLNLQWQKAHGQRAEQLVNELLAKMHLLGPDGNPVKLTDEKKQQMVQAWMPISPELLFKLNPDLARRAVGLEEKAAQLLVASKPELTPDQKVCMRIAQVRDVMAEFRMNTLCHNNPDPDHVLTGPALLAAIRANRLPERAPNKAFGSEDHPAIAAMIGLGAQLAVSMQANRNAYNAIDNGIKAKMQILHEEVAKAKLEQEQAQTPERKSPTPLDYTKGPSHPLRRRQEAG